LDGSTPTGMTEFAGATPKKTIKNITEAHPALPTNNKYVENIISADQKEGSGHYASDRPKAIDSGSMHFLHILVGDF
jgi:hypothetical protein